MDQNRGELVPGLVPPQEAQNATRTDLRCGPVGYRRANVSVAHLDSWFTLSPANAGTGRMLSIFASDTVTYVNS